MSENRTTGFCGDKLDTDESMEYKKCMVSRLLKLAGCLLFLVPTQLHAQVQIIEFQRVQLARSLQALVCDAANSPMAGVSVEEFSSDWKESLRSTTTDAAGRFTLVPVKGRDIYYLQLRIEGWNPLRVRVRVDPKHGKELHLKMEIST